MVTINLKDYRQLPEYLHLLSVPTAISEAIRSFLITDFCPY